MAVVVTEQSRRSVVRRISVSIGIASPFISQYSSKAAVFKNGQIEKLSVEMVVTDEVTELLNIR